MFAVFGELDPSVRTSATTTTTTAAAAPAGISHFGRLRGARGVVPAGPPGEYHSPGTSGAGLGPARLLAAPPSARRPARCDRITRAPLTGLVALRLGVLLLPRVSLLARVSRLSPA